MAARISSTALRAIFQDDNQFRAMQGADSIELGHWTFQANATGFVLNLCTESFCDFSQDFSNTLRGSVVLVQEVLRYLLLFNFDVQTNINLLKERYRGFTHALKSQAT